MSDISAEIEKFRQDLDACAAGPWIHRSLLSILDSLASRIEALEKLHPHGSVAERAAAASGGPKREQGACPQCGQDNWTPIPESLAQHCQCGYVRVRDGNGWKKGKSIQEWAVDLAQFPPREADAGQEEPQMPHETDGLIERLEGILRDRFHPHPAQWNAIRDAISLLKVQKQEAESKSCPHCGGKLDLCAFPAAAQQLPPPAPAATSRQEQFFGEWWERTKKVNDGLQRLCSIGLLKEAFAAGRESAQPQPAPDLGAAFEQWWENEGSKMPEWPPKPHAKQIFKAGAACRVSPWRDASKEKPEEGTPVWIAWNPPRGEKGEAWSRVAIYQKDGHWTSNLGGRINDRDPDYWLPLPPIPKGEAS